MRKVVHESLHLLFFYKPTIKLGAVTQPDGGIKVEDDIDDIGQILFKRPPAVCILGIITFLSEQQTWASKAVIASP